MIIYCFGNEAISSRVTSVLNLILAQKRQNWLILDHRTNYLEMGPFKKRSELEENHHFDLISIRKMLPQKLAFLGLLLAISMSFSTASLNMLIVSPLLYYSHHQFDMDMARLITRKEEHNEDMAHKITQKMEHKVVRKIYCTYMLQWIQGICVFYGMRQDAELVNFGNLSFWRSHRLENWLIRIDWSI